MSLFASLAVSLALTLLLELPVARLWGLRGAELWTVALAQVLTNPPVVLLHALAAAFVPRLLWAVTAALELSAALVEWRVYARCTAARRPLALSICANCFSYLTGLLLERML